MPPKIKTNQLAGYENTAFNYRYLNTTLTPLALIDAYHNSHSRDRAGVWVWNHFGDMARLSDFVWHELLYQVRDADRAYRLLADEYYRTEGPSNA